MIALWSAAELLMPLARRTVLRQLAPVLLSAAAPSLLWSPAQAAKVRKGAKAPAVQQTISKAIDVDQTLSFKLSEAWQGILPAKKMTIQSVVGTTQGTARVKGKNARALVIYSPFQQYATVEEVVQEHGQLPDQREGRPLATCGKDGFVRVWNAADGKKRDEFEAKPDVLSVASPRTARPCSPATCSASSASSTSRPGR